MGELDLLYRIFIALMLGLLIGIERGWQTRETGSQGKRVAGVRTYGLIALVGAVLATLSIDNGVLLLAMGFLGLAVLLGVAFYQKDNQTTDHGTTSLIAALLTYGLAALAVYGEVFLASTVTVATLILLSYKAQLHAWLKKLDEKELKSGITLLLISIVMLPVLPNESWGPWESLNPYKIWWMVVVIAAISFVGYFAIKIGGLKRGVMFVAFFGGLASSTAVTLNLAKIARQDKKNATVLACAILTACTTMFFRMLVVVAMLNISLVSDLMMPVLLMAASTLLMALIYWLKGGQIQADNSLLSNPLDLKVALSFGAILVVVMLLGEILLDRFGDSGLLVLATISGLADVDAIVLSLVGLAGSGKIIVDLFVVGCVIAAAMNSLVKGFLAYSIGGAALGVRVLPPLALSAMVAVWLVYPFLVS